MRIGYARPHPDDPKAARQLEALMSAGCERVFTQDQAGTPPDLRPVLAYARPGDVLVVVQLACLGNDAAGILETLAALARRGVGFLSLSDAVDATGAGAAPVYRLAQAHAPLQPHTARRASCGRGNPLPSRRGAKPRLGPADVAEAQRLLASGELTVADVAARLGVSRPTLYRYLPKARASCQARAESAPPALERPPTSDAA